jgi:hypothetical protein
MNKRLYFKHAAPTILSAISIAGVVATTVLAIKATPKALQILEGERRERASLKDEEGPDTYVFTKKEVIQLTWKCYIPTAITGLATMGCILGANVLNQRNQAHLASAYALLEQTYKNYRQSAISVFGEDADDKIRVEMAKRIYISADGEYVYDSSLDDTSEKLLFYDSFGQRYFQATMASVLNAEYHFNRNLALRGDVSLNEFFTFLGLAEIDGGDEIGWSINSLMEECETTWLDFTNRFTKLEDNMECYIISAVYDPTPSYIEDE